MSARIYPEKRCPLEFTFHQTVPFLPFFPTDLGKTFKGLVQAIYLASAIPEIVFYIILFNENYKVDQQAINLGISQKELKTRKKKNIVNLSGQFSHFLLKTIIMFLLLLRYLLPDVAWVNTLHKSQMGFNYGLATLCYFWSSPELKRHYFNYDSE